MLTLDLDAEVHPPTIRRPRCRRAFTFGPDLPPLGAAVEWNETTRMPGGIHLQREGPLPIGRRIRQMHHSAFVPGEVDLPILGAICRRAYESHMFTGSYLRKQEPVSVEPGYSGRIG